MRARWALLSCGIKVYIREVNLKSKPAELLTVSGKATVPVLITNKGQIIDQSIEIMKWCLQNSNIAKGKVESQKILSGYSQKLINENDIKFKYHLDRYKYPNRYPNDVIFNHEEAALKILRKWNEIIRTSALDNNSLGWLSGGSEGFSDWAIWPFVRQFSKVNIEKFESDETLSAINLWLNFYTGQDLFLKLMEKYEFWNPSQEDVIYP